MKPLTVPIKPPRMLPMSTEAMDTKIAGRAPEIKRLNWSLPK